MLVRDARDARSGDRFWAGADVVVEVVGPDSPERDLVHKRGDYAEEAIPAYRIVDPGKETITVLDLEGGGYVDCGVYGRGTGQAHRLFRDAAWTSAACSMRQEASDSWMISEPSHR